MISQLDPYRIPPVTARENAPIAGGRQADARIRRAAKRAARDLAKRVVVSASSGLNRMFGDLARRRFGILMYHRVADRVPGVAAPTWNVTPAAFRAQMCGLRNRGYQAWSLRQLIYYCRQGVAPPSKTFVVTFDDAHESVFWHAWPVLKELGIPATLFLATAYLDSDSAFPFDDWSAAGSDLVPLESWRPISTRQCRYMAAGGLVELGAHTHTHQDFCDRPLDFESDLALNLELLRSQFGVESPTFAFPFGRATEEMMTAVDQAGCVCGLTTFAVPGDPRDTPFGWGRFDVESWDTAATLAAKLGGWYSWAPQLRQMISQRRGRRLAR